MSISKKELFLTEVRVLRNDATYELWIIKNAQEKGFSTVGYNYDVNDFSCDSELQRLMEAHSQARKTSLEAIVTHCNKKLEGK